MEVPEPSSVASQVIKPINKGVVHRICSGQVILDLSSAVKELVENSLDAGATSIEIAVREYGEESFQVIDNGSGISPQNFKLLALKHHTSKLTGFPDLQSLVTFGFRGEALSSLCALGDLTVETRTKNEPVATHLTFDHSGLITAERKTARQIGTTVTVKKLFSSLPVRSKEFRRNIRKEYGKLITLLNAYALIAKGVRLVCTNTVKSSRSVVLKTQGTDSLKDNIITVFGVSTYNCLEPVSMCILDDCKIDGFLSKPGYGSGRNLGDRQFFFVNGRPVDMPKVSKLVNELYRGANSKQYPIVILNFQLPTTSCDVNVTPDKRKVFFSDEGSLLKSLRGVIENIYSPDRACYQVNKLMELQNEDHDNNMKLSSVVATNSEKNACCGEQNSECMISLSSEDSPASLDIHDNDNSVKGKDFLLRSHRWKKEGHVSRSPASRTKNVSVHSSRLLGDGVSDCTRPPAHSSTIQSSLTKFVTVSKRKHESISTTLTEMPLLRNGSDLPESGDEEIATGRALISSPCDYIEVDDTVEANTKQPGLSKFSRYSETILNRNYIPSSPCNLQDKDLRKEFEKETLNVADSVLDSPKNVQNIPKGLSDAVSIIQSPELSLKFPGDSSCQKVGSTLQFSLLDLKTRRQQRLSRLQMLNHPSRRMKNRRYFAAATIELPQLATDEGKSTALAAATSELERLFRKEDFRQMKVIGQFNLGFIVGKVGEDLFIVDQHAADEKYNYERLSQSTVLNQQPLLQSPRLELSPEEEIVVSMHMDIVRRNGFSLEEDPHAPPGRRFKLKAVPFSKNITFGVEDLKELISIVADGHGECSMIGSYRMDTADSVCPPRVRAMLASRACRTSVMVGDPLGRNEMQKILEHLADLRSPWNCPHGRPTMRHLVDLRTTRRLMDEDESIVSIK